MAEKARSLTEQAEESGDLRTALLGLREIARLLELKARLAGELAEARVNVNIATLSIERLTDEQARELYGRLSRRLVNLSDFVSPERREEMYRSIVQRHRHLAPCRPDCPDCLEPS